MPPVIEKPPAQSIAMKAGKPLVSTPPEGQPAAPRPPLQGPMVPPSKPKGTAAQEGAASTKASQVTQKDKVSSPALPAGGETAAKTAGVVNMSDLRSCLITLLVDNPKGMTIKVLLIAVGFWDSGNFVDSVFAYENGCKTN
jgi:hypothetical protein